MVSDAPDESDTSDENEDLDARDRGAGPVGFGRAFANHGGGLNHMTSEALAPAHKYFEDMFQISSSLTRELEAMTRAPVSGLSAESLKITSSIDLLRGLTPKFDFGDLFPAAQRAAEQIAAQQADLLRTVLPAIGEVSTWAYPPNLRSVDGVTLETLIQIMLDEGFPLYAVPRAEVVEALISADGSSGRREVLGRRWKTVVADCRAVVEGSASEATAAFVPPMRRALDALDGGHAHAAQSLAASLIDALTTDVLGDKQQSAEYKPHPRGTRTTDAYMELGVRKFLAFAPVWQAYQRFDPDTADSVPRTFSRHATAHTVSPRQYNRRNAVQAAMIACGMLAWKDGMRASLS